MADGYLEKRYDEVFGPASGRRSVVRRGVPLEALLRRNRSVRTYRQDTVVTRAQLEQIVAVNTLIPSARNQQVLRFCLVTRDSGAEKITTHLRLGGALPELHLPVPGTAPEAFVVICSTVPESRYVDMDLGISVQSMLLKAAEMGLNGIAIGAFDRAAVQRDFALPSEPLLMVAVGLGDERIELVPVSATDSLKYYRRGGVHYVPKIRLKDLLIPTTDGPNNP